MNDCVMKILPEGYLKPGRFLAGAALVFWISAQGLLAGDPIILSTQKPRINPELEKTFDKDLLRSWSKLPNRSPLDGYSSPSESSPPTDSRRDKKARDAQAEKKNWLLLEPGELQDQNDDASFGIKDYSLDDLEKKEEVKDYTFYNMRPAKSSPHTRSPGQRAKQDDKQNQAEKKTTDDFDLDGKDDSRDSLGLSFDKDKNGRDGKTGAHVAKELSMDTPFSAKKTDDGLSGSDKAAFTLRTLLEVPGGSTSTRSERNRSGNFQQGLGGGQAASGSLSLSGRGSTLSDATRGDLSSPGSGSPRLLDIAPKSARADGFSPGPNVGGAASRFNGPSLSEGNFPRSPGGSGDFSGPTFRAPEPSRPLGQSPILEPPRRKF